MASHSLQPSVERTRNDGRESNTFEILTSFSLFAGKSETSLHLCELNHRGRHLISESFKRSDVSRNAQLSCETKGTRDSLSSSQPASPPFLPLTMAPSTFVPPPQIHPQPSPTLTSLLIPPTAPSPSSKKQQQQQPTHLSQPHPPPPPPLLPLPPPRSSPFIPSPSLNPD